MSQLTVLLVSMFAITSVALATEVEENPGTPFARVYEGLDEANEKLDINRQAILDTAGGLRDLAGGSTHWVSPRWQHVSQEQGSKSYFSSVTVLNTSFALEVFAQVNFYDSAGNFVPEISRILQVPPRQIRQAGTSPVEFPVGWMEVVSSGNVFVEGRIVGVRRLEDGNIVGSESEIAMTWYRFEPEADAE